MTDTIGELERLARLRTGGAISDQEFTALKGQVLASDRPIRPTIENSDEQIIRRLADYEKASGIAWIVIGALQVCMVITIIAGVWNVIAGLSRMNRSKAIRARDAGIPEQFSGTAGLIVLGVVNLCLGAVFGLIMVGADFYIRDQVLSNARLFDHGGMAPAEG